MMSHDRRPAYLAPEIFAELVEQAAIAIKHSTDAAGLRYFIRPDLTVLANEMRVAFQKAVDASPHATPRFDIEIKDFPHA